MPRGKAADIAGKTFGRLTVVCQDGFSGTHSMWLCTCACGSPVQKRVRASELTRGTIRSCGCIVKENLRAIAAQNVTHGKSGTRVYQAWLAMKNRCLRPSFHQYADYGGRGVTVAEAWMTFETFYADMGDPPSDDHSIERRDNNLVCSVDNCFWATRIEQSNNKRSNHLITFDGRTQTLTQWSRELEIPFNTIRNRIKRGWSIQRALER